LRVDAQADLREDRRGTLIPVRRRIAHDRH
jgi:hypothetical protein